MDQFRSLTVLLPVTNEQKSLELTLEVLLAENGDCIEEVIFIVGGITRPGSRALCEELCRRIPLCRVLEQRRPHLGGALRDAFEEARGTHILLMASDLETDPAAVKRLVAASREQPQWIVTASRWKKGGGFRGYSPLKLACNFLFQKVFAALFRADLSDLTYGFRIFPSSLVQGIRWKETGHAFLFESLVKPLCLGVKVKEVPVEWKARTEGESQAVLWRNLFYLRVGLFSFLSPRSRLLK